MLTIINCWGIRNNTFTITKTSRVWRSADNAEPLALRGSVRSACVTIPRTTRTVPCRPNTGALNNDKINIFVYVCDWRNNLLLYLLSCPIFSVIKLWYGSRCQFTLIPLYLPKISLTFGTWLTDLLPINHKNYKFREKENSPVTKERENLHQKTDKGGVNCWMVVIGRFKLQL